MSRWGSCWRRLLGVARREPGGAGDPREPLGELARVLRMNPKARVHLEPPPQGTEADLARAVSRLVELGVDPSQLDLAGHRRA
jgi:hypothetical protein